MCLFFSDGLIDWSSTKHHKWESSFVCMCRYICATYCIQLMLYDAELLRQWGYWWGENILGWYFKNYIRNQLTLRELGIHKLCGPNGLLWFGDNFITNSKSIQTIPKIPTLLVYRTDGDLYRDPSAAFVVLSTLDWSVSSSHHPMETWSVFICFLLASSYSASSRLDVQFL